MAINSKGLGKVLSINALVLGFIILLAESVGFFLLKAKGINSTFLYGYSREIDDATKDACQTMTSHPFLGFTHKTYGRCKVKEGNDIGAGYVVYKGHNKSDSAIVTYGGSTTDGFFQHLSAGETWPMLLNRRLQRVSPHTSVINGGNGGFSSSAEVLKFLLTKTALKEKFSLKAIVSLNGINELPGYTISPPQVQQSLPLWNSYQLKTLQLKRYINIDSDAKSPHAIFPSIGKLIEVATEKHQQIISSHFLQPYIVYSGNTGRNSPENPSRISAKQWADNVKAFRALASSEGLEYLVFLQPTMGISLSQRPSTIDSSDGKIYKNLDQGYIKQISDLYSSLRRECARLSFCVDISDIAKPSGSMYSDARHHNARGNLIIADRILRELVLRKII